MQWLIVRYIMIKQEYWLFQICFYYYYFCDSRNIIKTRCQLFFCKILVMILKYWDILFGSDYKRENQISQAADDNSILVRWNERVVIMHSYADVIEMKRANVRNYTFVRRVIEMKRMSVNYSFAESFACIQMRMRNKLRLPLVSIFALVRDLKAV